MTHPAINQARRILDIAGVPKTDPTAQAVIAAAKSDDVDAALNALAEGREKVGALSYMIDELFARVEREQRQEVA
jgi:hypothetical protein